MVLLLLWPVHLEHAFGGWSEEDYYCGNVFVASSRAVLKDLIVNADTLRDGITCGQNRTTRLGWAVSVAVTDAFVVLTILVLPTRRESDHGDSR